MSIEKLTPTTPDLTKQNVQRLAELFPECVTEGPWGTTSDDGGPVIDFDLLRQALSNHIVEGPQERYRLDWPGKRQALLTANTPIDKTLRPMRADSVDFDSTRNLFIEGDNLDALKLLQETYLGKVKMIYIDPPYNTGKDFIYKDNFSQSREDYEAASGQRDIEGGRLVANPETNGRFHSDWLSMMYPRLKLARNLLRDDGVLFVSIDDAEQQALRFLLDDVFGAANFVSHMVWEKGRKNDAKLFSNGHEYILVYARSLQTLRETQTKWREEKPGAREIWQAYLDLRSLHGGDDAKVEAGLQEWFTELPRDHLSRKWARYRRVDRHGPWRDGDISWPGGDGPRYDVIHPETKLACQVPERGWIFAELETMQKHIDAGVVVFRDDHSAPPFRKMHLRPIDFEETEEVDDDEDAELAVQVRGSYFYKQSQVSVRYLRDLMGKKVFNNPKDHEELSRLISYIGLQDGDTIVDFFAGSGSTAEAVLRVGATNNCNYRFITVQIPESIEAVRMAENGSAKKTAANAIAVLEKSGRPTVLSELTKERIRLAGKKIIAEKPELIGKLDVGFRAFRIDSGNLGDVTVTPQAATQAALSGMISHIKDDRSDEDLLFGALLNWGVDITLPVAKRELLGRTIWLVDPPASGDTGAALIACFARPMDGKGGIDTELADALAALAPLRVLFRDDGFASDAAKENVASRLKQRAPDTAIRVL